jgi:hypothetical protein
MAARILLLVVIALLIVAAFRGLRSRARSNPPAAKSKAGEAMVTCARCGVHQPLSIAMAEGDKYYCKDNPRCRP